MALRHWHAYRAAVAIIANPAQQAAKPRPTERATLKAAASHWPCCSNVMVCTLNVEKVVNPPSTPVTAACRQTTGQAGMAAAASAVRTPIASDPDTFTNKVPQGKPWPASRTTASVSRCRATPPAALPTATAARIVQVVRSIAASA